MTPAAALLQRVLPGGGPADDPVWAWLRVHGLPTTADETWRYTDLDRILTLEHVVDPSSGAVDPDLVAAAGDHGGPRVVFVDGAYAAELSDVAAVPAGVRVGWGNPGAGGPPADRYDGFRALNRLAGGAEAEVLVRRGARVDVPLHVVHVGGGGAVNHPRTTVRVGRDADVTVIETYLGAAGESLANAVTSISVERDARLRHHKVLLGPAGGAHVAHTALTLAAGADASSSSVLTGAAVARHALDVVLGGDRAVVDLRGLDLPTASQRHDTAVTVEHAASHGSSRQLFKAAVDDRARSSFSGRVIVGRGTVGNDADQTSRSLLLAPAAQADSRPWLEIFADDVRCTHGSSTGRLDDDALFFLRSRGIRVEAARAMLVGGFIAEMTDSIEPATLRALVESVAGRRGVVA